MIDLFCKRTVRTIGRSVLCLHHLASQVLARKALVVRKMGDYKRRQTHLQTSWNAFAGNYCSLISVVHMGQRTAFILISE